MTMNSFSPVMPLDARRMCSRSERFILAQNSHPRVLRHNDRERATVPHAESLISAIRKFVQDARHTTRAYQIEPLLQSILGMDGIIGIGQTFFNPVHNEIKLRRVTSQHVGNHLVHFVAALFDELVPVHRWKLTKLGAGRNVSGRGLLDFQGFGRVRQLMGVRTVEIIEKGLQQGGSGTSANWREILARGGFTG